MKILDASNEGSASIATYRIQATRVITQAIRRARAPVRRRRSGSWQSEKIEENRRTRQAGRHLHGIRKQWNRKQEATAST
ncbi:hypothetical protein WS83_31530 [Burkholderia sp. MSMB2042]|uniref:Uncharacterized protein n=1 Tax=Burkholderia savannae TaxID=1637837 RepID=A0ABR5T6L2_9BURK|nr:hypothetical protein WS78_25695 [Burkholderia savannae]KVG42639.1 hypothetical protein WS77_00125 [Burkholderia sp. MSMB0265]KVG79744.1 hypothetical protein WS81_14235 [Burkholderia sp. MSMB2040]KVG97237.1 hypothetical protein WS83_31530 [Burkholderia sp. MSMB2042]KVG98928.1 hypothetical protein WS82_25865 [Burkholderia sp. MSMB2041]KVK75486.1 hypothetical protein WS91_17760 [Burkholderia sp. MSMB1498]